MKKDKVMFIVDFGLAKEYIDPDTNKHIPYRCRVILVSRANKIIAMMILMTRALMIDDRSMNLKFVSGSTSH